VVADAAESIHFTRWDIFHGGNICDILGGGVAAAVAAASIYFRGLFFRGDSFHERKHSWHPWLRPKAATGRI